MDLTLQGLAARAAIRDVLVRYFRGLDSCDLAMIKGCFTEDVRSHYEGRVAAVGIAAFAQGLRTFRRMESGEVQLTTHFMGNLSYLEIEGDAAQTETCAIAFLVPPPERSSRLTIRSLRYLDRFRRDGAGWKIAERRHLLDWSAEADTTFALTFAQRMELA